MTAKVSAHPAIELRNICKRFNGEPLVDDFDLSIEQGESAILVGPSGSGKTTLLNLISLVASTDAGQVILDGTPYRTTDLGIPKLAYIFQRDLLHPWETVGQSVMLGIEAKRTPNAADRDRAHAFLDKVGLAGYEGRYPGTLSGGQRQLVAIIQNLLLDPDILLLDEPFSNVDFPTKLLLEREVIDLLEFARLHRERPMTMVMVTHDIEEAIVLGTRVISLGRPKGRPLKIVRDARIDVRVSERDPILMRGSELLRKHFLEICASLESFSPAHPRDAMEADHVEI